MNVCSLVVNIWRNLIKSVSFAVHQTNRLKFGASPYHIINEAFVLNYVLCMCIFSENEIRLTTNDDKAGRSIR